MKNKIIKKIEFAAAYAVVFSAMAAMEIGIRVIEKIYKKMNGGIYE